ncbi:MAG: hypothetical protein IKC02_01680 [Oscillospiraceae bacterium]|nr:hypothetical protein [Oscillospiraceae bacterium]
MANELKELWKETGKGLGHAFRDLGKTLLKTGAEAIDKADEWLTEEERKKAEQESAKAESEQE